MTYRKKPVEIEAFQYDGDLVDSKGNYYVPDWAKEAYLNGTLYYRPTSKSPSELFIKTLEGDMLVRVGFYIIRGVRGELYAIDSDIFEDTYERVI